ncbi:MAG: hypothetical protein ACPGVA_09835 [Pikeienuella sp.]
MQKPVFDPSVFVATAARYLGAGIAFGIMGGAMADTVTIAAPDSSVTIAGSPRGGETALGVRVIVEGWSCGADVTPDVVAVLAELNRRRSVLSRQVDAGKALAKTPAIQQERDQTRRLRTYDDALAAVTKNAPPEIRALTRKEEGALAEVETITGLRAYQGDVAAFRPAGVTDGGETQIHVLPDCFQTSHVKTLIAQMRGAATEIAELRDALRQTRRAVATGGGV